LALCTREIPERHLEGAAHLRVEVIDVARKSVRWQPLGNGVGFKESAIHALGRRAQHPV
jgi:hypothetical protein